MSRGHIAEFVFEDADYFVAHLDNKNIRIGFKTRSCFDIPAGHAWFDRVAEADNRDLVKSMYEELVIAYQ